MRLALIALLLSCAHPARPCLPAPAPDDSDVALCLVGLETGDNLLDCFVQGLDNRNKWIAAAVAACGVK